MENYAPCIRRMAIGQWFGLLQQLFTQQRPEKTIQKRRKEEKCCTSPDRCFADIARRQGRQAWNRHLFFTGNQTTAKADILAYPKRIDRIRTKTADELIFP